MHICDHAGREGCMGCSHAHPHAGDGCAEAPACDDDLTTPGHRRRVVYGRVRCVPVDSPAGQRAVERTEAPCE